MKACLPKFYPQNPHETPDVVALICNSSAPTVRWAGKTGDGASGLQASSWFRGQKQEGPHLKTGWKERTNSSDGCPLVSMCEHLCVHATHSFVF